MECRLPAGRRPGILTGRFTFLRESPGWKPSDRPAGCRHSERFNVRSSMAYPWQRSRNPFIAMTHVAIICGYDRFSDLHQYAADVAAQLAGERVDAVVVSGGFTSPRSGVSEAALMARVLTEIIPDLVVVLEERAMTTLDNLVFGRGLAEHLFGRITRFVVFCDVAHRVKVAVLSRIILGVDATVRAVHRVVPWFTYAFEPVSIVVESTAALVRPLRSPLSRLAAMSKGLSDSSRR